MRFPLTSLWWLPQHLGYLPHILQFQTLLQQESLPPEIIFMPGENKESKCYLFCAAAFHSGYTPSHITRATVSHYGCLGDCYLNTEHTFLLLLLLLKKRLHKSGRGRKKMELKQHNYINFSSILSIRWECQPQKKPSLLLGVTQGEKDAWNSNGGRARDTSAWSARSFQMGFEECHSV